MTAASSTGWLFRGASLASETSDIVPTSGLHLTPAGRVALISGDAAIRQSIILLLTTVPGERVMRPDYGCPLHRLMFAPNDATTAGLAIHYVRQAIARFEPRIEVVSLDAGAGRAEDGSQLLVSLVYKVKATNRINSVEFEVGLDGGGPA